MVLAIKMEEKNLLEMSGAEQNVLLTLMMTGKYCQIVMMRKYSELVMTRKGCEIVM